MTRQRTMVVLTALMPMVLGGHSATLIEHRKGPAISLRPVDFPNGKMTLSVLTGDHDTQSWDEGGVLTQYVNLDRYHRLRIVVRAGEGESRDNFRREHPDAHLSAGSDINVCGQPAVRLEASEPERRRSSPHSAVTRNSAVTRT